MQVHRRCDAAVAWGMCCVLFKAFFLFIAGTIAVALFGALIGLVFGGMVALPFADFLLDGWWQHMLVWVGLRFSWVLPFLALINLGYTQTYGSTLGQALPWIHISQRYGSRFIGTIALVSLLSRDFSSQHMQEDTYGMSQPSGNKLYIM